MSDRLFHLPARIARLGDLAYNLWWSWHPSARNLFRELDPHLWEATSQNPVFFLHRIAPNLLQTAARDAGYLEHYDAVVEQFDAEMSPDRDDTWVARNQPELRDRIVAYFSAEFGVHRALPIYSGGLGVLAGDHIKEASDLGLPMVAVSLLYRQGYLSQRLTPDGWQEDVPADLEPWSEPTTQVLGPDGKPLMVEVVFDQPDSPVRLAIWKVQVGRVALYLLDADVDGNPEWTRTVSSRLYGGDLEHRLRQEIILGIGGVRALRSLGIEPDYWHANEGHAAFHLLERLREYALEGLTCDEAARRVRANTVFTSHTPVPAGHDIFPAEMIERYFGHFWEQIGMTREEFFDLGEHGGIDNGFNLTALSMRLAEQRNGVSERHGEITRIMWNDVWPERTPENVPITSVTNGVHLPTWISPRVASLLDRNLGRDWRERQHEPDAWDGIRSISDEEFWDVHAGAKRELFDALRSRSRKRWISGDYDPNQVVTAGPYLEPDVLTIGFARRFATYKRATLIFHDPDRLARLLNSQDRPIQIIFAGKAHPADEGGRKLIQDIIWRARDPRFAGRIAFAEDYDMGLAAHLVAGVDVWLNNPRAPLEASGTSGMKAAVNGAPNLSILDGWWHEGWARDNSNGWGIEPSLLDGMDQDAAEAELLYEALESVVIPLYYDRDLDGLPHDWIATAKESIRTVAPAFSARRMVIEYITKLYARAASELVAV